MDERLFSELDKIRNQTVTAEAIFETYIRAPGPFEN